MDASHELTSLLRGQEIALFVGAGLSIGAGLPSWSALVKPWSIAVGARWPQNEADLTVNHLLTAIQHYENQRGRNTLIRSLRDSFNATHLRPTVIHRLITALSCPIIFTTNYDDLLERSFREANGNVNVIVAEPELAFWREDQTQLVKLCGDLNRPDSIVISHRDFNTYFATHPRLAERLRTTLESKTPLFLGYGLQDPFLNQIWDNIGLNFGSLRRWGYAVLFDAHPLDVEDLHQRGIHAINLETQQGNQTERLEEWLRALVAQAVPPAQRKVADAVNQVTPDEPKSNTPVKAPDGPIKILFLAANPKDTHALRIDAEIRAIDQALRKAQFRDRFEIQQHWAVRISDLQEYLLRHQPHIVHFSGHGSISHEIILEDESGNSRPLSERALSRLFALLKDNIRCVLLNACFSKSQAQAIAKHIDCVIGMSEEIGDNTAINFSAAFYQALGFGRDIKTAFELACVQLDMENLADQTIPQLLSLKEDPSTIVLAL